jgi:hypothetical protein
LIDDRQRRGVQLKGSSSNVAISACEKRVRPEEALQLWEEMKQPDFLPNAIAYSSVIHCVRQAGASLSVEMNRRDLAGCSLRRRHAMLQSVLVKRVYIQSGHCCSWQRFDSVMFGASSSSLLWVQCSNQMWLLKFVRVAIMFAMGGALRLKMCVCVATLGHRGQGVAWGIAIHKAREGSCNEGTFQH